MTRTSGSALLIDGAITAVSTGLLGAALYFGQTFNIWLLTGSAGVVILGLIAWLRPDLLKSALRPSRRNVVLGVVSGLVMILLTEVGYRFLVPLVPQVAAPVKELYATLHAPPGPLAALPVFVIVVLAEELVWRGIAFERLRTHLGVVATVSLSVALYVLPQLANPVQFTILVAAACGLLWTVQRAVTGSVLPGFVTHLTWNLGVMVMVPVIG